MDAAAPVANNDDASAANAATLLMVFMCFNTDI
jgi:hypothetical protein